MQHFSNTSRISQKILYALLILYIGGIGPLTYIDLYSRHWGVSGYQFSLFQVKTDYDALPSQAILPARYHVTKNHHPYVTQRGWPNGLSTNLQASLSQSLLVVSAYAIFLPPALLACLNKPQVCPTSLDLPPPFKPPPLRIKN